LEFFNLTAIKKPDWIDWKKIIQTETHPEYILKIALVGKYVELHDAYISVREALKHACLNQNARADISWIHSEKLEQNIGWDSIRNADGMLVPGGFGLRGIEGKIQAIMYARENKVPYLGLCLGMQLLVVEFARFLFNDSRANSTEFSKKTPFPVIDLLPGQREISEKGGTMRLGLYPCMLIENTIAYDAYAKELVEERHRHRYEVNNKYRSELEKGGLVFSGQSPDGVLAEIAEIKGHPFMLGCQFHPEFLSRPNRPHPLFSAFVKAIISRTP
jgi:CTP synthase